MQCPVGQRVDIGEVAGASELPCQCVGGQGTSLRGQVAREWWCWSQEAGRGVLIIGFRTWVQEFNRYPSQPALPVSCPD